ncbi:MAG: Na/Pi symporter [Nitriliruptorales bacterium]|nr:Na/Pi symporter [Nitriliruptorales bacterium]
MADRDLDLDAPSLPEPGGGRRLPDLARFALVLGLLYLFLVGVALLESGIEGLGSGFQDGLLESVSNPIAGVFAGILATVLVQSSSVSTSTIVGLVGAGTLTIPAAVPMVMGANIGTTVTNTLASLGHMRRGEEFRRAFAGATMHDFFNLLAVVVLLPLELLTGFLSDSAQAIADVLRGTGVQGGKTSSPIKEAVKAPAGAIESMVHGGLGESTLAAVILLALGLAAIFVALTYITKNMRQLVAGSVEKAMNRLIGRGGGAVGIIIGLLATLAVQSSSITTSILVPLLGAGLLTLRSAYPITLGANLGTTVTALLASLAVDLQAGLVVALTHTLFNATAIAIFYPIPGLRDLPIRLAQGLADLAMRNRSLVVGYVGATFVALPALVLLVAR